MNDPIFEIHGTGAHNRGAELMAEAIGTRLRRMMPGSRIAVGASYGSYEARCRHGFLLTDAVPGKLAGTYTRLAPKNVRPILGLVPAGEVSAVLDATGFGFTDQMGTHQATVLLKKMTHPKRAHQKLILMPQAFGPFEKPEVASVCRQLFERADLIYARDPDSQRMVNELMGAPVAKLCCDFTLELEPQADSLIELPERFVTIVPNFRMLKRKDDPEGKNYYAAVRRIISGVEGAGLPIILLMHSASEDRPVVEALQQDNNRLQVLTHSNPLVLKWILSQSTFVVGSRFHALVSTLSKGVPALGLGWSHKYKWLFDDFGLSDYLLPVDSSESKISDTLSSLLNDEVRAQLARSLGAQAKVLQRGVSDMWEDVVRVLA